ncbi:hypothetical protein TNCV_359181 [Trichonephila clavipes]|nr:hypothetical protein TNCV_359181 [Trichonephila clavipes]
MRGVTQGECNRHGRLKARANWAMASMGASFHSHVSLDNSNNFNGQMSFSDYSPKNWEFETTRHLATVVGLHYCVMAVVHV